MFRTIRRLATSRRSRERGQGMAEFALVVPLMMLLAIAVGDFGRMFTAAIAVESAAREAADYGAFLGSDAWAEAASPWTVNEAEMRLRACTAAGDLADYDNSSGDCSQNPTMTWELIKPAGVSECAGRSGLVQPCRVHVRISYVFKPFISIPPIPASITLVRDSWFAISDLPAGS